MQNLGRLLSGQYIYSLEISLSTLVQGLPILQHTILHIFLQYVFYGSTSSKPAISYLLKLPEDLQDAYMKEFDGVAASAITITHLKRELVQKVWELLLDDEFMEVYKHGIVITCADGVIWQIYPRFFTYSADYPEKCITMQFLLIFS